MRLPIDAELQTHDGGEDDDEQNMDFEIVMEKLIQSREETFSSAAKNIDVAQKKQKETYDGKHFPEQLPIGAKVLVENTADKQRKGGKLNPAWCGPYIINKYHEKGVYQLSNEAGDIIRKKVNIARLKLYTKRDNLQKEDKKGKGNKRKGEDNDKVPPKKQCVKDNLVKEILAGNELGDEHMTFATTLLQQQFPNLGGLQSTLLAQNNGFCPVIKGIDSIQIHHTGQFHWVTSTVFKDTISVYDSKYRGILSSNLQVQLALIYKNGIAEEKDKKFLLVKSPAVQQQRGSTDCGVFAIAFAYHAGKQISYIFRLQYKKQQL